MSEVIGIIDMRAAEGRADEVVAAFAACIAQTHQEEGCLTYALHQDAADPHHLVHVERWRSQADLDEHMTKPYVAELFAAAGTPGLLAGAPSLTFATSLALGDPAKGSLG
jgi:quinol monooxygenase YgiN